jgi:hypothetical protein
MKAKSIKIAILAALLIIPSAVNAATINFDYENGTLNAAARTFTFDILLENTGLANVDGWNLGFDITRKGSTDPFSFTFDSTIKTNPAYVLESSFDYQIVISPPTGSSSSFSFVGGDVNTLATPGLYLPGGILARLTLDDVEYCNWFDITLNESNSFLFDSTINTESILQLTYEVHVVPVPAAIWMLGSGLFGLIAVRRKT